MKNLSRGFRASLLVFGYLLGYSVLAQEAQQVTTETDKTRNTSVVKTGQTNPYTMVLGSFLFRPELSVTDRYDSNIFAERDNEIDDSLLIYQPSFLLTSNWSEHLIKLNIGGEIGRFNQHASEDYDDYWLDFQGRYDISEKTNFFGGLNHTRDHEERGTPEVVGTIPTTFSSDQAHVGFAHSSGKYLYRFGGTFEHLDYDDAGPVNNDDRDRDVSGLGLRVSYRYAPSHDVFAQAIWDRRDYKNDLDDNGFDRNSEGYRLAAGFKGHYSNRLRAEAYLGRLYQKYEDDRFYDVDTLAFGANVKYLSSARSQLSVALNRSLEETTLEDASSYLYNTLSVQARRQLSSLNSVVATFAVSRADYQDVALEEDIYNSSIEWRHRLYPEFYVALNYSLLLNDSNQATEVNNPSNPQYLQDYARHQVMLTLNTTLFEVNDPGFNVAPRWETLKAAKNSWQGFYFGAQLGYGATQVGTYGIRGTSGTDTAEFGDTTGSEGLFTGFGANFDRWYLGVEAEAERSHHNITHSKNKPISRSFSVSSKKSHAINLRGGYTLRSGPLFYARYGKAQAEFDTSFRINNEPGNAVDDIFEVDGTRYGIGTDVPLGDSVFLRMDYSYTNYDSYVVDAVTTAEKFDPSDHIFHLGLGWLFGGNGKRANVNTDINMRGFYAGLQLGHGSLNSYTNGIHNDSGSLPGTYDFTGDFGNNNHATGGLFAGVGENWDNFYLGLEAETEGSGSEWTHERAPTGRDFGVKKKSAVGIGLRAGYQLNNGTLLYLTGSRMRTRFITNWIKGNNSTNYINRDDKIYADRLAIGADIPTSRSVFLRMNYVYTDYEPYRFVTSHGGPDDMTFENNETLFRLGLGIHF